MDKMNDFLVGIANTGVLAFTEVSNVVPGEQPVEKLINGLVTIVGGVISTVLIRILKNKFPELFKKKKV